MNKANMFKEKNHTMQVTVTPTASYAGDNTWYDITVSLLEGGYPQENGLTVGLYNSTGALVLGDDAWVILNDYLITEEEIILSGGTYHIYAYNATSDSKGHNATLIIHKYDVISSPPVLIWKIDTKVNMTFQLLPAGNGTLKVNNMTSLPNASYPGQSTQIAIEKGVGTLDGVNATTLGNVTFFYTPDGGQGRSPDGVLKIISPSARASFFAGFITDLHDSTGNSINFKAKFVYFALFNPFEIGRVIPYEQIWISREYKGYIGSGFVFGFFTILLTEYP